MCVLFFLFFFCVNVWSFMRRISTSHYFLDSCCFLLWTGSASNIQYREQRVASVLLSFCPFNTTWQNFKANSSRRSVRLRGISSSSAAAVTADLSMCLLVRRQFGPGTRSKFSQPSVFHPQKPKSALLQEGNGIEARAHFSSSSSWIDSLPILQPGPLGYISTPHLLSQIHQ